ncbi:MAG: MFS transporter [Verrucomicrobiota bacterium]|nr:MFS transporter [Verrucomicrobiota bacterium]
MASELADIRASARKRIAWRLLPFLFLLYIANYLDRTNIAYATLGMKGDLRLSDSVFGTASGIFFIGYFALQIPGALLVERWSARKLLSLTLVVWGALTSLTAFVQTPAQLYGARFLLGAAEAGFFPGVIVYLSHWFIAEDRGKAVSRFMAAIPIGFMIGGPIAGSILGVHWLNLPGWRWLFVMEGAPAIVLGIATVFYLPDRPDDARWLQPNERTWLNAQLAKERAAKPHAARMSVGQAIRHPAVIILTFTLFCTYTGGYAFWLFFPTILQRLTGWTDVRLIGWVGAIPFAVATAALLYAGWSSDRMRERRWHFAVPQLAAAVALASWFILPHSNALLVAICAIIASGTTAYFPAFFTLPSQYLTSAAAAAAIGFINCTGSIGGFVGPKIFGELSQRTGALDAGFVMMIACWLISSALVLLFLRDRTPA